jgi:HEAT repeat protein
MLGHLPILTKFGLDDEEWDLLRIALMRAGARSQLAIPILTELAQDSSGDQENASRTLATFGPQAQSAIPALLDLLARRWEQPRQGAIAALQQIASEKSARLVAALKHPNACVRSGVVEVLGHFPGAIPVVTEALNDPSARVRLAALKSLTGFEEIARPAIPQIRGLLQADSRTVREAAAPAIEEIEQDQASTTSPPPQDMPNPAVYAAPSRPRRSSGGTRAAGPSARNTTPSSGPTGRGFASTCSPVRVPATSSPRAEE